MSKINPLEIYATENQIWQEKIRFYLSKSGHEELILARFSVNYFRKYYLKKRNKDKSYKEAIIVVSTKFLRTIYALLNESRCFK